MAQAEEIFEVRPEKMKDIAVALDELPRLPGRIMWTDYEQISRIVPESSHWFQLKLLSGAKGGSSAMAYKTQRDKMDAALTSAGLLKLMAGFSKDIEDYHIARDALQPLLH